MGNLKLSCFDICTCKMVTIDVDAIGHSGY